MNRAGLLVLSCAACTALPADEDGRDDRFLIDGKADGAGDGSRESRGVLAVANTASRERLCAEAPDGVGLSPRAAEALLSLRDGDDGLLSTDDDVVVDTLARLDAVPHVGPIAFARLLAFARAHDLVPELALPLTAEKLADYLAAEGVRTPADAVARLPLALRQHFVLVTTTHGLGRASRALPRPALYSRDARFILTFSGHAVANDPTAESFEIIDVDPATEDWRVATIRFAPDRDAQLDRDASRCVRCHGAPARPIWGEYPDWTSAYGGSLGNDGVDDMSEDERAAFAAFEAAAPVHPSYRALEIHSRPTGFRLPSSYGLPNTVFTARLGTRHGRAIYHRLSSAGLYPQLASALQLESRSLDCGTPADIAAKIGQLYASRFSITAPSLRHKIYRLLGVEPRADLRLDLAVEDAGGAVLHDDFQWNAGGDFQSVLAEFLGFVELLGAEPALRVQLDARLAAIDEIKRLSYDADGDALEALDRTNPSRYFKRLFPFLHYNAFDVLRDGAGAAARRAEVCRILAARARNELGVP